MGGSRGCCPYRSSSRRRAYAKRTNEPELPELPGRRSPGAWAVSVARRAARGRRAAGSRAYSTKQKISRLQRIR
eukprot:2241136-Prymnesium_polylepis.1